MWLTEIKWKVRTFALKMKSCNCKKISSIWRILAVTRTKCLLNILFLFCFSLILFLFPIWCRIIPSCLPLQILTPARQFVSRNRENDWPVDCLSAIPNEPRYEKTCLRGLRSGKTQTSLLSYRSKLEAWNFGIETRGIILSRQRTIKVLIRFRIWQKQVFVMTSLK